MPSVAFDTLKLARALRDRAGMPHDQAEGAADAIAEAIESDVATKEDLLAMKCNLMLALSETKVEIIKRVAGIVGLQTLAIIGTVLALAYR